MYCSFCGSDITDDSAFCPKCGKKLGDSDENSRDVVTDTNYSPIQPLGNISMQGNFQQPYIQQPYTQPTPATIVNVQPGMPQQMQTTKPNGLCVASFIVSMVGIIVFGIICGIVAVLLGAIGLSTYDEQIHTKRGLGVAGIIVGIVEIVIYSLLLAIIFA